MLDPKDIRRSYDKNELSEADLTEDPMVLFKIWFEMAVKAEIDANAFDLATSVNDIPNVRIVLLKGFDQDGFTFFTNYRSEKGDEMQANPKVAMNFYWRQSERQVRILGTVRKVSGKESDEYFRSRPFGSRIGAIASNQSSELNNMKDLLDKVAALTEQFKDQDPPRPEHWGGYLVEPDTIEFWQGKPNRLHDRFRYTRDGDSWKVIRLFP